MFGSIRRYKRGWTPSFDFDFFRKPTIRDTGKGSAKRRTTHRSTRPDGEPLSYEELKQQCLDDGALWEDPDFPAEDSSIYFNEPPSVWPDIQWCRPSVGTSYLIYLFLSFSTIATLLINTNQCLL